MSQTTRRRATERAAERPAAGGRTGIAAGLDRRLDSFVAASARFDRPFRRFGAAGVAVGAVLGLAVVGATNGSLAAAALILVVVGPVTYGLGLATAIVLDRETLIFLHHALAVVGVAVAAAATTGAEPGPLLAGTGVALMAGSSIGRLGCLAVGCCHGRPARHGVRYPMALVADGFPAPLVDLRLRPVQLLDAALTAALAVTGGLLAISGRPATAAVVMAAGYGLGRIALQLQRGDRGRRLLGLDHVQWTVLAIAAWLGPLVVW